MKIGGFDHIDLRVRDLAAAQKFYGESLPALGFRSHRAMTSGAPLNCLFSRLDAVFFEDPSENKLEICHRASRPS